MLNNIQYIMLGGYTTIWVLIYLLYDISVASSYWQLWKKIAINAYVQVFA